MHISYTLAKLQQLRLLKIGQSSTSDTFFNHLTNEQLLPIVDQEKE